MWELVGGREVSGCTGEWCHSNSGGLRHWSVRRSWDVLMVEKTAFTGGSGGLSSGGRLLFSSSTSSISQWASVQTSVRVADICPATSEG